MSLFRTVDLVCPGCECLISMPAVGSVNADRRPDFRDAILEDHFQDTTCAKCGHAFRLQPQFNYLDVGRCQWLASLPAYEMPDYLAVEDTVLDLFDISYGKKAPAAARSVGDDLDVRVTFGWPAIREKIQARQDDLDDVVLELLKLDLIRRLPEAPLGPGTELRYVRQFDDKLVFVWIDTFTEEAGGELLVERSNYDAIIDNAEGWAATRALLVDGPFVDMQKLYMGDGRSTG